MEREELLSLVNAYFPYKTARIGQKEVIVDILNEYVNEGKTNVVLEAPTGAGKSVIGYVVAKVLKHLDFIRKATFITHTKLLGKIYEESFGDIFSLNSSLNYPCHFDTHYGTTECKASLKKKKGACSKFKCEYYKCRERWSNKSILRATNSAFFLCAGEGIVKGKNRSGEDASSDFLVIDECHKIEQGIIEQSVIETSIGTLKEILTLKCYDVSSIEALTSNQELILKAERKIRDINEYLSTKLDTLYLLEERVKADFDELSADIADVVEMVEKFVEDNADSNEFKNGGYSSIVTLSLDTLKGMQSKIELLSSAPINTRLLVRNKAEVEKLMKKESNEFTPLGVMELNIQIIDSYITADSLILSKTKYTLSMSGTVCGYDSYIERLGIKADTSKFIAIDHPIPKSNRTIYGLDACKIRGQVEATNKDIEIAVTYCDAIMKNHKDEHGFIFLPSYNLCKIFIDMLEKLDRKYKRRLVLVNDLNEVMSIMRNIDDKVVVSAGIVEGVDLKDDMCRFQIIPKLPYPYLGDMLVKIKKDTEKGYYDRQTSMSLVQVCGRGVRTPSDKCETYILDSELKGMINRAEDYIPTWFRDAIVYNG